MDVSCDNEEPRLIKFDSQLTDEEINHYKSLIIQYRDIFIWSYKDLKKISREVALHKIPLLPNSSLVRQKERQMNLTLQLIVKVKLEKLLQVGFIKPIEITDWISPMVLVKKKNGKL